MWFKHNELHKFQVLPKRWIVERTFAWLNWSRRLSKDYELRTFTMDRRYRKTSSA